MKMERRVAALERRIAGARGRVLIIISGGLPSPDGDPDPKFATAGDATRWECGPAETFAEFRARVRTAAAATARHIVFGGLPEEPMETDSP
jgi:hypothetical protein